MNWCGWLTCVQLAVNGASLPAFRALLPHYLNDLKKDDGWGLTMLTYAAVNGHAEITRHLLHLGAIQECGENLSGGADRGSSELKRRARRQGRCPVVAFLKWQYRRTPLPHLAGYLLLRLCLSPCAERTHFGEGTGITGSQLQEYQSWNVYGLPMSRCGL